MAAAYAHRQAGLAAVTRAYQKTALARQLRVYLVSAPGVSRDQAK